MEKGLRVYLLHLGVLVDVQDKVVYLPLPDAWPHAGMFAQVFHDVEVLAHGVRAVGMQPRSISVLPKEADT